jgi:hypothetical protein
MKKLILSIAIAGLAVGAFAQGLVSLSDTTVLVSTNNGTIGALNQPAGAYYFELLYIADPSGQTTSIPTFSAATLASWTDSTLSGTNAGAGAPPVIGHIIGSHATTGIAVPGWLSGENAFFVVLGWSANEGTWANVSAALLGGSWLTTGGNGGLFGNSIVGYALGGTSPAPADILFGSSPGLINVGWQLTPVPEPSTIALAGLGALGMLMFRRRK